jgi:hypothetical protein
MILKIYIIGLNLYSIILATKIKKDFKKKVSIKILEGSNTFLTAYNAVRIDKYYCNPGFHAYESIRSIKLINFLKKIIKFKKINKSRGMIIGNNLISYQSTFSQWPRNLTNKFNLSEKNQILDNINITKKVSTNYLNYLKNNLADNRLKIKNSFSLIYPWFFPANYKIKSKDEGAIFNQKIREKKIKHSFLFPKSGLFRSISEALKIFLAKNHIEVKKKTYVNFTKSDKKIFIESRQKLNKKRDIKIICVPVVPLANSIKDLSSKNEKLTPIKLYTGLLKIKNVETSEINKYCEIIVSSEFAYGLRRISLYSEVMNKNKNDYIYQIEFVEHKKYKDITQQIKQIIKLIIRFIKFKKSSNHKNIQFIGYVFLRNIYSPDQKIIDGLATKVESFFLDSKNIFFPRKITWPINSNKHMIYANIDYKIKIKKQISNFIKNYKNEIR